MSPLAIALVVVIVSFGLGAIFGAPFLPTHSKIIAPALELTGLKQGDHLLDLGCGTGTLMIAAARRGIRSTGYEINPLIWLVAKLRLWPYRKIATVHYGDYWRATWPKVDVIYVFLIGHYMAKLERELGARIKTPTKVVTYTFTLPKKKPAKEAQGLNFYEY